MADGGTSLSELQLTDG